MNTGRIQYDNFTKIISRGSIEKNSRNEIIEISTETIR